MPLFTVHEPPNPPVDPLRRAENIVFVRDGFETGAALLGPLWLALRRHWPGLAAWGIAAAVLTIGILVVGARPAWIALALVAMNIIIGFEASDLRRDRMAADGWSNLGLASGDNASDAERGFFEHWAATVAAPVAGTTALGHDAASAANTGRDVSRPSA